MNVPRRLLLLPFRIAMIACAAVFFAGTADAQVYVANSDTGLIGSYDSSSGAPINASLVTGLNLPQGLAILGTTLFVAEATDATVSAFDANTGAAVPSFATITGVDGALDVAVGDGSLFVLNYDASDVPRIGRYSLDGTPINATLITTSGFIAPGGIAVGGGFIYITDQDNGNILKYTTAGSLVSGTFVTGLDTPIGLTLSDGNLYVALQGSNSIGLFDAATGAGSASFITAKLTNPWDVAVGGGSVFVSNYDLTNGRIGQYALDGSEIEATLVSGLHGPTGLVAVPEPGAWKFVGMSFAVWMLLRFRRQRPAGRAST